MCECVLCVCEYACIVLLQLGIMESLLNVTFQLGLNDQPSEDLEQSIPCKKKYVHKGPKEGTGKLSILKRKPNVALA